MKGELIIIIISASYDEGWLIIIIIITSQDEGRVNNNYCCIIG